MQQTKQKCVAESVELKSTGKRKVTVGSVWKSNNCGYFEVVEYKGNKHVLVRFIDTSFEIVTTSQHITKGQVRDKLHPSVFGVGFLGVGEYPAGGDTIGVQTCHIWRSMMARCYNKNVHSRSPTYIGCEVCKEWHNYQNFAKWYQANHPMDGKKYALDKDLKVHGNKIYSPDKCMLVSYPVNNFIINNGANRGSHMIGVSFDAKKEKFNSHCRNAFSAKQEFLGLFSNELEAHLAWRKRKSELAYELAISQDRIEVRHALLRWRCALDNFEIYQLQD